MGIHRTAKAQNMRNDDAAFTRMCRVLGDEISFALIKSTIEHSRPAIEIARAHHLPLSSVYKKVKKLIDLGLVGVERIDIDSRSGKKIAYYRSRIASLELSVSGEGTASLTIRTDVKSTNKPN